MLEILCSENTGSVSLFSHMQKADFLMARLKCELGLVNKQGKVGLFFVFRFSIFN